jgi:hypothetical protein
MGLSCASAEMIIQEHLHRPITGKVLLIGRQNTDITPQAWLNLLDLYGLKPRIPIVLERRGSMEHKSLALAEETDRISDTAVFHGIADCEVLALDISAYEGAEVVHDLNLPLPAKYRAKFDFIFDGSSLDNIFNVTQALFNMSEMLRPGGRMVLYNTSNSHQSAYLQFSPDWFWDYFAINGYADCKVYVHEFPQADDDWETVVPRTIPPGGYPPQAGCLWHFDPLVVYSGQYGLQNSHVMDKGLRFVHCLAEKAATSTSTVSPVQMHYRGGNTAPYIAAARRFRASGRPLFYPRTGERFDVPSISTFEVLYPLTRWNRRTYSEQRHSPYRNCSPAIGDRFDPEETTELRIATPPLPLTQRLAQRMKRLATGIGAG